MKRGGPLRRKSRLKARKGLERKPMKRQRAPLPQRNEERLAQRRAEQFGEQAELCRRLPCCACKAPPPSDPAHVVSRGAGGKDKDTVPLCRACHDEQHQRGINTFQAERGVDLRSVASDLARRVDG